MEDVIASEATKMDVRHCDKAKTSRRYIYSSSSYTSAAPFIRLSWPLSPQVYRAIALFFTLQILRLPSCLCMPHHSATLSASQLCFLSPRRSRYSAPGNPTKTLARSSDGSGPEKEDGSNFRFAVNSTRRRGRRGVWITFSRECVISRKAFILSLSLQ